MRATIRRLRRAERFALAACALASLILRGIAFFHYRFDSDEPQHLHVAWGWTAGLIPYRDYFDNHAPLFHMVTAPLLAVLGERSGILFFMRAAMLPLFAIVLFCTYRVARVLYSRRIALWSVVLLSLWPSFFLKSLEYRTDNLWNTLWMVSLLVVLSGRPSPRRWFLTGLLIGCALSVSLKTTLLIITLTGAGLITRWVKRDRTALWRPLLAAAGGLVIVPSIVALYFRTTGAWADLVYCTLTFNRFLTTTRPPSTLEHVLWPFAIAAIVLVCRRHQESDFRRVFCGAAMAVFLVTLVGFWILISPRDMLPVMPLGVIFAVAACDRFDDRLTIASVAAAVLVVMLFYYTGRFRDRTTPFVTMMDQTLRLTRPGEPIMDLKGETIYRPRPYYYIFELITHEALQHGLLADGVPEAVVAAPCYVAQADGRTFPPRARRFLSENFLDLGRLRAAGQWIGADGTFRIAVPGPYVILDEKGLAGGFLDGSAFTAARSLVAGGHRFASPSPQRLAVLWAPAFERGFSPFHLQDRDFSQRRRHSHHRGSR